MAGGVNGGGGQNFQAEVIIDPANLDNDSSRVREDFDAALARALGDRDSAANEQSSYDQQAYQRQYGI